MIMSAEHQHRQECLCHIGRCRSATFDIVVAPRWSVWHRHSCLCWCSRWCRLRPMKAIRVSHTGGTEVLQYVDIETPKPGPGEARVRMEAIGVNFIDVYHRTGLYKLPLPFTPGSEGAGVVEAVGDGVDLVKVSDHVAFAGVRGAYAE